MGNQTTTGVTTTTTATSSHAGRATTVSSPSLLTANETAHAKETLRQITTSITPQQAWRELLNPMSTHVSDALFPCFFSFRSTGEVDPIQFLDATANLVKLSATKSPARQLQQQQQQQMRGSLNYINAVIAHLPQSSFEEKLVLLLSASITSSLSLLSDRNTRVIPDDSNTNANNNNEPNTSLSSEIASVYYSTIERLHSMEQQSPTTNLSEDQIDFLKEFIAFVMKEASDPSFIVDTDLEFLNGLTDVQKKTIYRMSAYYIPSLADTWMLIATNNILKTNAPAIEPFPIATLTHPIMKLSPAELWMLSTALNISDDTAVKLQLQRAATAKVAPSWSLLYDSDSQGKSIGRVTEALLGYTGPTLMLIFEPITEGFAIFGAYCSESWKSSSTFITNTKSQSFLFSLRPKFRVYRPTQVSQNFMYLYSSSNSASGKQTSNIGGGRAISHSTTATLPPEGVGFGGQLRFFRLFVESDLQSGDCKSICSTYEKGPLREDLNNDGKFKIAKVQFWGLGGLAPMQGQDQWKAREEHLSMQQRKVNVKRMMLGEESVRARDQIDMKILEMAGVHSSYDHDADHT